MVGGSCHQGKGVPQAGIAACPAEHTVQAKNRLGGSPTERRTIAENALALA
jgi:hypothetical protein